MSFGFISALIAKGSDTIKGKKKREHTALSKLSSFRFSSLLRVLERGVERQFVGMQRTQDQRSRSAKPTTIHGYAQFGDLLGFQRLLRENPSLLNERNPVVRSHSLFISSFFIFYFYLFKNSILLCAFILMGLVWRTLFDGFCVMYIFIGL